nr:hypothetical protein [Roseiconus lacunae]
MNDLNQHYSSLLGLNSSWSVEDVILYYAGNQVAIRLALAGAQPVVPNAASSVLDTTLRRSERGDTWIRCSLRQTPEM